jgi:hypothetical protein
LISIHTDNDGFSEDFSWLLRSSSQALENLRSKTANDLIAVKDEDASIVPISAEEGEGEEEGEAAAVHRSGRPKKSKTAQMTDDEISIETKTSVPFPVQISPAGRPMRVKAGKNKHLEMQ